MKLITALIVAIFIFLPTTSLAQRVLTSEADIQMAQINLTILKYKPGPSDGKMGKRTRSALKRFQINEKLSVTAQLDEATADRLGRIAAVVLGRNRVEATGNADQALRKRLQASYQRLVQYAKGLRIDKELIPRNARRLTTTRAINKAIDKQLFEVYQRSVSYGLGGKKQHFKIKDYRYFYGSKYDFVREKSSKYYQSPEQIRSGERCFKDGKWKYCYHVYIDAHNPDILYFKGLNKRPGANNGNWSRYRFVLRKISNKNIISEIATSNAKQYGNTYNPRAVAPGEMLLQLLATGEAVDEALRGGQGGSKSKVCPRGQAPIPGGGCSFVGSKSME